VPKISFFTKNSLSSQFKGEKGYIRGHFGDLPMTLRPIKED
jgi:hypothetical protein